MGEHSYLLKIFMLIIYQSCWKFFMCLIFVIQGYPRKLFNLEHFPIYGISFCVYNYMDACKYMCMHTCNAQVSI